MEWKGRPSKIRDFWSMLAILAVTAAAFGISLLFSSTTFGVLGAIFAVCLIIKFLDPPSPSYNVSDGQLTIEDGKIFKDREFVELFRVKDISTSSIFFLDWFKIGKITLITNDATCPKVVMKFIKNYENVAADIRKEVLKTRKQNNMQEIDIE